MFVFIDTCVQKLEGGKSGGETDRERQRHRTNQDQQTNLF